MGRSLTLKDAVLTANTGLDAIKRAPIVDRDTGVKCLRIQDVSQSKSYNDWGFTEVEDKNYSRFQLVPNDILIARTGASIGVNRFVDRELNAVFNNGLIRIRVDQTKHCPKFIYYLLQSEEFKQHIGAIAFSTSAQPNMKIRDFLRFEFEPLGLVAETLIAEILTALDNKISLNRQTNQTIEQITQAIFKSWFVNFDPVKAKIATLETGGTQEAAELAAMCVISGKDEAQLAQLKIQDADAYKQLAQTAALFPAAMQESELGEIPEGWRIGSIGEIAKAKGGFAFKSNDFTTEGNEVVKIKNITGDGRVDLDDCDYISDEVANKNYKFKLNDGDLLMAMTGATVGKVGIVATSGKSAYVNQRVAKFESDEFGKKISWFLYPCIQRQIVFDSIVGAAQGSAQPNISSSGIESTEIVLPTSALTNHFCDKLDPYFQRWISNNTESRLLAQLRDTVLPKLLSGEISLLDEELI